MPAPSRSTPTRASPTDLDHTVVRVVDDLVNELRGRGARPVSPDDSLERDLGLGSLERVELLLRLERRFGVQLPDRVMAEAERVRDLAAALRSSERAPVEQSVPVAAPIGEASPAPTGSRTVTEAFDWHVQRTPERIHALLRDEDGTERALSYASLWRGASRAAEALRARGVQPGETVGLMLPTGEEFFHAFLGALLARAIPVPLYPPLRADRIEEYVARQIAILRNADTRLLVTFAPVERVARLLRAQAPSLRDVVTADHLGAGPGHPERETPRSDAAAFGPLGSGSDLALIQYTSGSTGTPKGVTLTHDNLLANIRTVGQAIQVLPSDVTVSWLPLYHDMGLIGSWLGSLYYAVPLAIMSPLAFLSRPSRWLWSLHRHRGTVSPAPNFAFDLCAKKIPDEELEGLDLSSVRLLLNGSEAIVPETIERFQQRFSAFGLRPDAILPVYGLAESAVGLTTPRPGTVPVIDRIERQAFEETGRAVPVDAGHAGNGTHTLGFVGCGQALPDHEVRVVDRHAQPVAERVRGRIQFRGPSMTPGYFRNPDATAALMTPDGWADTGDLGYMAAGHLFITGRRKDIIIKGGRNLYPPEIEEVVGSVAGVRRGCVAAFGAPDPTTGTERLVVVAETREVEPTRREALRADAVDRVAAAIGLPPDEVVLSPPGSVLKTSSGKIRRGDTRVRYLSGALGRGQRSVGAQWLRLVGAAQLARLQRTGSLTWRTLYTIWVAALTIPAMVAVLSALMAVRRPETASRIARTSCRLMLRLAGIRVVVRGAEQLATLGPALIVANHASYLDVAVILGALPMHLTFAAKGGLTRYPVIGHMIRRAQYVIVDRAGHATKVAAADELRDALCQGRLLFVFPEGTFRRAPGLLPFRLGAFRAAVDAGRPVVPLAIDGTRRLLPDQTWLLTRTPVTLTFGEPLYPDGSSWQAMVRLRDAARSRIASCLDERELLP